MKKTILLLTIAFIYSFASIAKEVDVTTAMNAAKVFYCTKATTNESVNKQNLILTLAYKYTLVNSSQDEKTTEVNLYYIFNVNTSDGFVIVAGDDIVKPILGYSNKGNYDETNIAPAFQKWMENYKEQILYAKQNLFEATLEIKTEWEELNSDDIVSKQKENKSTTTVNPLLSTTWNQSPYYNALCPSGTVTGCVATAMAQIMKYWNYPTQGVGFHSYNDPNYGTQSANFAATTYNWSGMPNNVSSSNSSVATLMYHCGVSVDMTYGTAQSGGSSAYVISSASPVTNCAEYAYKTYFNYNSSTIQGLKRSAYTDAAWKNLLKNDLNNSRPIQYAGFGTGGGHTFVCDGFDINDYFHMNWGWGGIDDGYFDLDALNPASLGIGGGTGGFNSNQQAVIGIQPASGGVTSLIDLYSSITISPNPIGFGQAFTVNADVTNSGSYNFSGDFCAALFNSAGDFIDYVQILSASGNPLQPGYHYTGGLTFSSTGVLSVPGSYIIGIYFRDAGGDWNLAGDVSYTNPVSVTISSPVDYIQLYSSISPSPTTFVQGQAASVNVNLINDNTATYYGQYAAVLYDLSGNFVQTIGTYNETAGLPAGYIYNSPYITFSTSSITAAPGTYILAIQELENGFTDWYLVGGDYYSQPINIDVVAPPLSPDIYEANNTQGTAYNLSLNWVSNSAHPLTTGSNNHIGTDYDYYKVVLTSGYNYTITARAHDSYNSGNGNTYTNDVLWSYNTGGGWSTAYDDIMSGNILVNGTATVTFQVSPYFTGTTGTYLFDISIVRVPTVGIDELSNKNSIEIFPNPASTNLNVNYTSNISIDKFKIMNIYGQVVVEIIPTQTLTNIDISGLSNGMYFLEATESNKLYLVKFIISK